MASNRWFSIILLVVILAGTLGLTGVSHGSAVTIVTTQGRMSSEFQISSPLPTDNADRQLPQSAYNKNRGEFLVVWQNKWSGSYDIYGQRIATNGKKIGSWFAISSGPGNRIQPAVAFSYMSNLYFVVYMHDVSASNDGSRYVIEVQRVRWDGQLLGPPMVIQDSPTETFWSPRIAYHEPFDEFLMVWGIMNYPSQIASGIAEELYSAEGVLRYGCVLDSNGNPSNPDLVWNPVNNQYLVVWNRLNPTGKNVIIGDLRDGNANRIIPPGLFIIFDDAAHHALFPRVTYSGGYYSVVFEYEASPTDHDIYISWVKHDGTAYWTSYMETSVDFDSFPVIAGNPNSTSPDYMILFQRAGVNGASVWLRPISNYMTATNHAVCSFVFWDCTKPSITKGGAGYLMTHTADAIGNPNIKQHVFGRMFWQFNAHLPLVIK